MKYYLKVQESRKPFINCIHKRWNDIGHHALPLLKKLDIETKAEKKKQ